MKDFGTIYQDHLEERALKFVIDSVCMGYEVKESYLVKRLLRLKLFSSFGQ